LEFEISSVELLQKFKNLFLLATLMPLWVTRKIKTFFITFLKLFHLIFNIKVVLKMKKLNSFQKIYEKFQKATLDMQKVNLRERGWTHRDRIYIGRKGHKNQFWVFV